MKILVLTTIYPSPDINVTNTTSVVHYFAKEWVKQGHDVRVVYNYPIYLKVFHWIGGMASRLIASKYSTAVTSTYVDRDMEFCLDGVKVIRMPLFKPMPHGKVPQDVLEKHTAKIHEYCANNGFEPDCITAHNFYPHLQMVNDLKRLYYPKAKTCVVVHKQNLGMLQYVPNYKAAIANVDIWGYRSLPLKSEFEGYTSMQPSHFMCYSGIPAHFLRSDRSCNICQPISRFVYVGSFIRRKYPEKLLSALEKSRIDDFELCYVGDGVQRSTIERFISKHNWQDKVELTGFIEREKVPEALAKSQCFIMISEGETFGLVYLEAMSMGCITVASRGEGMEGIIEDGVNGFLCKAGDDDELAQIILKIRSLSNNELAAISRNARQTALQLTDSNVAAMYASALSKN